MIVYDVRGTSSGTCCYRSQPIREKSTTDSAYKKSKVIIAAGVAPAIRRLLMDRLHRCTHHRYAAVHRDFGDFRADAQSRQFPAKHFIFWHLLCVRLIPRTTALDLIHLTIISASYLQPLDGHSFFAKLFCGGCVSHLNWYDSIGSNDGLDTIVFIVNILKSIDDTIWFC